MDVFQIAQKLISVFNDLSSQVMGGQLMEIDALLSFSRLPGFRAFAENNLLTVF